MRIKPKYFLLALPLLVGVMLLWLVLSCSEEISQSIGEFETREAAERASIKKMDAEIRRCPKTKRFYILWTVANDPMQRATKYYRREGRKGAIGYEQDAYSGFAEDPYEADDGDIKSVAETYGTLADFRQLSKGTSDK